MKRCTKCGEIKESAAFSRDRSRKDGLQVCCKDCQRSYRQANRVKIRLAIQKWRRDNPDKVKAARDRRRARPEVKARRAAANKAWKAANPDKVAAQAKRSYARHADKRRKDARQYAKENPDKVKKRNKKWRKRNADKIRAYRRKNRSKDLEYYARTAKERQRKKEAQRQWCVYQIDFNDGTFYLGSSCYVNMQYNAHKSLASRGLHSKALNEKDFSGATLSVLKELPSEEAALEHEAQLIQAAWGAGPGCLNKQLPLPPKSLFWVYVIQSLQNRVGKRGQPLPGFFYVGMTTDPARRLREHNGLYANGKPGNPKGGRYTSKHRPWGARALHGPYYSRSEALRAESALKRQKRGPGRLRWSPDDSVLCRGEGPKHPWVLDPTGWHPPTPQQYRDQHAGAAQGVESLAPREQDALPVPRERQDMKVERHTGPRPWKVARSSTETAFVVSEDGHAILAIPSANIVLVPYFQRMLPEQEYIDALVKTCLTEKGKPPEILHVFEHEGLIGFCAQ